MSWDWIISFGIIAALILTIWAKASHMTIPELLGEMKDRMIGGAEDTADSVREISF